MDYINHVLHSLTEFIAGFGPAILKAAITLILGFIILKILLRITSNILKRSTKLDEALKNFLESLIKIVLYFVLVAIVGTVIGVKASSFVAILGAAGIAIGLALQGSLANF